MCHICFQSVSKTITYKNRLGNAPQTQQKLKSYVEPTLTEQKSNIGKEDLEWTDICQDEQVRKLSMALSA